MIVSFGDKLLDIKEKFNKINDKLMDSSVVGNDFGKLSKEKSNLEPIVEKINEYIKVSDNIKDAELIIKDKTSDIELKHMAEEELFENNKKIPLIKKELEILLLPKDEADEKNAILEIRAGTGGDEAALFAGVLLKMYQKYAERKKWKFEIMDISGSILGGVKEAIVSIKGINVFKRLKMESGGHRVQRVPETETKGRVHTSAATVAVLPEAEEVDIKIEDKDLEITVCRSGGPGGQSVNTTDSAVRIVHLPTGISIKQQEEKSQHRNKDKAMKLLRAKLYEIERTKLENERSSDRKEQIGSGDRSDKIRTYNYPQSRITDHRINLTSHKIESITNEGDLDEIIDALIADYEGKRILGEN